MKSSVPYKVQLPRKALLVKLYAVIDRVEYEVDLDKFPIEVDRYGTVSLAYGNPFLKRWASTLIGRNVEYVQLPLVDGRVLMTRVEAWLFTPTAQLERG